METQDTTGEDFKKYFGGTGYMEGWGWYPRDYKQDFIKVIDKMSKMCSKPLTAMEIGSGGGWFTNLLCDKFETVYALDIIDKPENLQNKQNLIYLQRKDRQFDCEGVPDDSISFVFSFGTFCHISAPSIFNYLLDIRKKMRSDGKGLLMFADVEKNVHNKGKFDFRHAFVRQDGACPWFYCETELALYMTKKAGFSRYEDAWPEFRDALIYIEK